MNNWQNIIYFTENVYLKKKQTRKEIYSYNEDFMHHGISCNLPGNKIIPIMKEYSI